MGGATLAEVTARETDGSAKEVRNVSGAVTRLTRDAKGQVIDNAFAAHGFYLKYSGGTWTAEASTGVILQTWGDDFNRESLAIEADTSLPTLRLIRVLNRLIEQRGKPANIRTDNGPEFISHKLEEWCTKHKITIQFIPPGKPMQNGFIERKNGSIRKELLNAYLFNSLNEVREWCENWRIDYNTERPHKSLGYLSPERFADWWYKSSKLAQKLYPQMASGARSSRKESHLVDKIFKESNDQPKTLLLN